MILIKNARLIGALTEGYDSQMADVMIEGNKIKSISACGVEVSNPEIQVIDAQGKTLMPGLWDLHAHLYLQSQTCNTDVLMQNLGEELFDCYRYSREYLKQGYTSIRDVGGTQETAIYVRDAINRGDLKGSRVLASGLIITPTETGNKTFPMLYAVADSPDDLRRIARQELEKGADFLKYMGTGAFTNKDGNPDTRIATDIELKTIQEVAEMKHTYVAVHAHGTEAIDRCVEFGIRTIEHGSFVSDWAIEQMLKTETSFIIPTSSFWATFLDAGAQGLVANAGSKRDLVFKSFDRWRVANEAGLKPGWGTGITQPVVSVSV